MAAARILRCGGLVAHRTSTLPGVAASPFDAKAVLRLQRFKQRKGPFLLLADSLATAMAWARPTVPGLRRMARQSWPGAVTLVFPGRPGLPAVCYQQGHVAIRVDADPETRRLARLAGGLLLSTSLNRRGGATQVPGRTTFLRLHRWLDGRIAAPATGAGAASQIHRIGRRKAVRLR